MNIDYKKVGDYLLPNLVIENQNYGEINKYGLLRLEYIKKNKKGLYQALLMKNELTNHLFSVSNEAKERLKILMDNYIKNDEKLSKKNKENNQLEWVKLMNNYNNTAEEIILKELIYVCCCHKQATCWYSHYPKRKDKPIMATTSIWSIKNNLKQSINYIINPEKTINDDYGKVDYDYLEGKKDYNFKKEKVCYVSTLNCDENYPYDDMIDTKDYFNKKYGNLAYHGYQSFKEGEVTPDIAHEIGVKFVSEMFKDYEVVVATHQNTNHIHNHFIINSVSFKDGKKYNNNRTNLAKLRNISDSLCAEYGLSVLDEDKFYKRTYTTSISNDEYYKTLKEDLDNVISYSVTLKQLFERMRSLGYKVYSRNGVITIYRDGKDKVRIENVFGEEYSKERINQRLYLSRQIVFKPMSQKSIFEGNILNNIFHTLLEKKFIN